MTIQKIAYSVFVAFMASLFTLVSVNALSSSDPDDAADDDLDPITLEELAEHDGAESCWKAIHGRVYDVTDYVPDHPTEEDVVLEWCGREATEGWDNKRPGVPHSPRAEGLLEAYLIGRLVDEEGEPVEAATEDTDTVAERLSPAEDERLHRAMLGLPLDGRYRGVFIDRGVIQVNITFDLEDGHFTGLAYRHLAYRDDDYLAMEEGDDLYPVLVQYRQILERLEGQPVTAIFALYEPERVVDDVDGYTGATLRGAKVISAIRDALNRGVYAWP
ncbi:cytochrome b5 domain-containing protein [Halomonas campisalis]|uniref:Cytochrome b5 domain-containing protein n=1 Tax=Billgrantia campisalis TaxID=74661 RepID=A0ABS9PBJ6_9GAMM|nr:cytochrome b5-like heme/steroid binding domain-containing protein [Halomonas campisalis]MCG6659132.1 cytochrome b5 domain-containing protein [Halomonas campisalis]MDR5863833.1 cytochrome b5-like heme/steroid binding domain-containing protein [Halomonas campisalis]